MAKKKLFGNKPQPCCGTCALGKLSAEGDVVMCKHAGVVSTEHSCRRFRYDPLKRVPRRERRPEIFDEQTFSLEVEEDIVTAEQSNEEAASDIRPAQTPTCETAEQSSGDGFVPDDTADIFGDLASLDVELIDGSNQAVFRIFDPHILTNEQYREEDMFETGDRSGRLDVLINAEELTEEDDDVLDGNTLILLNDDALDDRKDETEMLVLNDDGSLSAIPPEQKKKK